MLTYFIDYRLMAAGNHEIHHGACSDRPDRNHLIYLGRHDSAGDALNYGRPILTNLVACKLCCLECNLHEVGSDYIPVNPYWGASAEDVVQ